MKTLKLGLFSLLAILTVSVFLTSCEQNKVQLEEDAYLSKIDESDKLVLPFGTNEDLILDYLNEATETQINTWKNNAEITERLASIGKLPEIEAVLTEGQNISEFDLKEILSDEDMLRLSQIEPEVESRGLCTVEICSGMMARYKCCKPPYGSCYRYEAICCGCCC